MKKVDPTHCVMCDNPSPIAGERIVYKYKDCGLDNVIVHGVEHHRCPKCGEEYYGFGNLKKLHEIIAEAIISKPSPINGKEFRFLRTHLGYSGTTFAKLLKLDPKTIARYESGESQIPKVTDLVMRALISSKTPDRKYDLHDFMVNKDEKKSKKASSIELRQRENSWSFSRAS